MISSYLDYFSKEPHDQITSDCEVLRVRASTYILGGKRKVLVTQLCPTVCDPMD